MRKFFSLSELTFEPFASTLKDGDRFMHLRASPNEPVRGTGARGRNCREDDDVEDMVDTERRMDEREGSAFSLGLGGTTGNQRNGGRC